MFSYGKSKKARASELIRNPQVPSLSLPINPPGGHKREGRCFLRTENRRLVENCFGKNDARHGSNYQGKTSTFVENEVDPGGRAVEVKFRKKANKRSLNP